MSLIVPLYNEERVVEHVALDLMRGFKANGVLLELVLVNNGSTDGTPEILQRLASSNKEITVVNVPVNEGYGWGIICGLKKARGEYLGFSPGDGQIKAEDVVRIFKKLVEEKLDLCKAKRGSNEVSILRRIQSRVYNLILPVFFPVQSRDVNRSPKIMSREAYEGLQLTCKDWFLDAEIMIKSNRLGLKVGEIPVAFERRKEGKSSVSPVTFFEFLGNILKYKIRGF